MMSGGFSWRNRGVIAALLFTGGGGFIAIVGGVASWIHCPGWGGLSSPCPAGEYVIGKEADNIANQLRILLLPGIATLIIAFLLWRSWVLRQSKLDAENNETQD